MKSFFFSIFLGREDFESRELCFDPTMEFGYVGGGGCCVCVVVVINPYWPMLSQNHFRIGSVVHKISFISNNEIIWEEKKKGPKRGAVWMEPHK